MNKVYDYSTALFNCNYTCNDNCDFCFNKQKLGKVKEMTLKEIKDNYYYVKWKYDISNIIITGGEPTLYSKFWDMMEFFYLEIDNDVRPSLNTNSIFFADGENTKKLFNLLYRSNRPRKQLSLSLSSINFLNNLNKKDERKIIGFENAIMVALNTQTKVYIIVNITEQNYQILPELANLILKILQKSSKLDTVSIQLRGLYIGNIWMNQNQINKTFPKNFSIIKDKVIQFINILSESKQIILYTYNLPLCLINNEIDFISSVFINKYRKISIERRLIISSFEQFSKIREKIMYNKKLKECINCKLNMFCSGIQKEYIDIGFINKLMPK